MNLDKTVFCQLRAAFCVWALLYFSVLPCEGKLPAKSAKAKAAIDFNRDIRPIFSENCYACHGPDKNKRKAGLRLDRPEDATTKLESGDFAIVPGDVEKSKLLKLVATDDEDDRMPPKKTGKRLSEEQIELLREWIAHGANWKEHWAYIPPERPELPAMKNKGWPRNEIDYFILARLEKEGFKPSPEAEKHTFLRRVTLDLTGLPPTISEGKAFLGDQSPKAYERLVDRLLASPHFGERMAIQWLDLARYADSDGYHADIPRSMWQYRDWVINAFNQNKPFDQFALEQIAGDLLPEATLEQKIATAFNRNGMSSTEGGADPDEYMNKYVTDRVNTFGTVFLGSSTACTECHDHKYDPFTQREYYQLYDFFNQIPEKGLDSDPAPPFLKVPTTEQSAAMAKIQSSIPPLDSDRKRQIERPDELLDSRQVKWEQQFRHLMVLNWSLLEPLAFSSAAGAMLTKLDDQSILVSGTNADKDTYEIGLKTPLKGITGIRLEALTHEGLPLKGASRSTNGNFILTSFEADAESIDPAKEPVVQEAHDWGKWSILGSFKAASAKEVFEKAFITETEIDLSKTYDDGKLKWTEQPQWKDGEVQSLSGENTVSYLYRTIHLKTARPMKISLASDGGMQVWLNGSKLRGGKIFRGVSPDPDDLIFWLKAGDNKLLLKVHHGSGAYGFLFAPQTEPVTKYPVQFASATADYNQKDNPARLALDDKADTGWAVDGQDEKNRAHHQAIFVASNPVGFEAGATLKIRLKFESASQQHTLGHFRIGVSTVNGLDEFAALPAGIQTALFASGEKVASAQKTELREFYRNNHSLEIKELNKKLAELRQSEKELDAKIPTLRVMADMPEARPTEIRVRGDYRHKGDRVTAGVPHILPPLPASLKTNRLALAKWLVDPKHPLLSRVTVNRYWALYFGAGLVKTGNEFGSQGESPSHPELLDWLAREFIDSGWDIKSMQKKIVMSATYRQSSKVTKELLARDPLNGLLARGPRLRLPAEMVRDNALACAGLLERKPGGPSVRPYQPDGLWEEKMFGGNKYEPSKGADLYRRSLYTLWKRTVPNPTLMTFDAPDRAICTEQRSTTCTPLQAFVTLNEKTFVEAARVFAARVLGEGGNTDDQRLTFAFKTVLARPPTLKERKILMGIYQEMHGHYTKDLKAAAELISTGESKRADNLNELQLVAWTAVANVLFNLDETVTKE